MKALVKNSLIIFSFVMVFASQLAQAENMKKLGNMDVHYMAIGATFLTPEIAKAYGIERSRYNGLLNISVLNNTMPKKPAMDVDVTGTARNDIGQIKQLSFKQIKEGNAIYYLAEVNYSNEETIYFDININDGSSSKKLKFKQKFYVD
jgi:hypothetical protein